VFNEEGKIEDIILDKPDLENHEDGTVFQLENYHNQIAILQNIALWHKASK